MRRLHGKLSPRLTGLPYPADQATRLSGSPHLSCKRDQDKIRNYMDRRVTPPRRVTSPTWGPPPPCKHALKHTVVATFIIWLVFVLNAAIFFLELSYLITMQLYSNSSLRIDIRLQLYVDLLHSSSSSNACTDRTSCTV